MKVLIAGGSGAIGRRLIPDLIAQGHDVTALTRSERGKAGLEELGARALIADALDDPAVMSAVTRAEPEVVISQLTALTGVKSVRRFDKVFALTNRLRIEGTDHLLAAAKAAGARRFIVQSYGNWNFERAGGPAKTEADAFDPSPPQAQTESMAALRHLEAAVRGAEGIEALALRYANFYGPGTSYGVDGEITALVRKRAFPIIGDGAGVWSFVHVDDAAAVTLAALERGRPGVYNVADDEPAPVAQWLPYFAEISGAKAPMHVPVWLGRMAGGEVTVSMVTRIRGAANGLAKREFDWQPRYPSWRQGFAATFGRPPASTDEPADPGGMEHRDEWASRSA
jgi:nucleoside-diphosphate-sugar epimerase